MGHIHVAARDAKSMARAIVPVSRRTSQLLAHVGFFFAVTSEVRSAPVRGSPKIARFLRSINLTMNNYLIGIGGTGAKCIEAVIQMSAAGLFGRKSCKTILVDLDSANGSLGRCLTTLQHYLNCRSINLGGIDAFSTDLSPYEQRVWNPLPEAATRSLGAFYSYDDPNERNQDSARLMEALYAPEHIKLPLNEGFRGVTSVGAAIMAGTVDLNLEEPWSDLFENLQHDAANSGGANVLLVGSIFGGTGAAGIPTIGRLIANHLRQADIRNVRLGAILILPYFSFSSVEGEAIQADSGKFLPSAQAALDYYNDRTYLDVFDGGVYLMGEDSIAKVTVASVGGRDQQNDPHPIELYAALAALDFFDNPEDTRHCMLVARGKPNLIAWPDLPMPPHLNIRGKIGQFVRFCYVYLSHCQAPLMEYVNSRDTRRTAWINTFFNASSDNFQQIGKRAEHTRACCESFLVWLGAMHLQARTAGLQLAMILPDGVVETEGDPPRVVLKRHLEPSFNRLLLPTSAKEGRSMGKLIDELIETKVPDPRADRGFPQLIASLYELCAIN